MIRLFIFLFIFKWFKNRMFFMFYQFWLISWNRKLFKIRLNNCKRVQKLSLIYLLIICKISSIKLTKIKILICCWSLIFLKKCLHLKIILIIIGFHTWFRGYMKGIILRLLTLLIYLNIFIFINLSTLFGL